MPEGPLETLEQSLLGETALPTLPLKERLQRLVEHAAQRVPVIATLPRLEDLTPGRAVTNAEGTFYLSELELPIDHRHGEFAVSSRTAKVSASRSQNLRRITAGTLPALLCGGSARNSPMTTRVSLPSTTIFRVV